MTATRAQRMRLGEILVANDVITSEQLHDALQAQRAGSRKRRLGRVVVDLGMCDEEDIAAALGRQLRLDTVDLASVGPEPPALARVPRKLADKHHALPLRLTTDGVLEVAMSDPTNVVALDDLKLSSGARAVRAFVATETALNEALRRAYGSDQAALDMMDALAEPEVGPADEDPDLDHTLAAGDDQPVIRLANAVLADAVRTRASDVHIEPERDHMRVRYRIDGILRESMRVPRHIGPALTSRIKIMSSLDIAERRRPQDGRAMIRVEGQEVDLRVSTMPTLFGETVVLRLLRKGAQRLGLDDLGMPPDIREAFETALYRPQGLIVMTGPTGSGKTTSLYAGLTELADPIRNVLTLEDPIEYQLEGVNQTQVNPKIDLTFARGLRTVLRQDPDVVMVGEIRDRETAELAMEASATGHLVLSTLHTNDSPSTIVRLLDLGIERFMIASALLLVIAQRLARLTCTRCAEPAEPDPRTLKLLGLTSEDLEGADLRRGVGCQLCEQTGYLGRIGLYEVLQITPRMRELITAGASETAIAELARAEGMRSLREDGLAKAFAGLTTLDEVLRTTPEASFEGGPRQIDPELVSAMKAPRSTEDDEEPRAAPVRQERLDEDGHPLVRREDADDAPSPEAGFGLTFDPVTGRASGGTVLVVEDDPPVRDLLRAILEENWVVLESGEAEEARKMNAEHRPDAVILDYRLPDGDGIELTRQLREDGGQRRVPIIMVTGHADAESEVEGLLAGVDDYLTKPFDGDVLEARLTALLRRKYHV